MSVQYKDYYDVLGVPRTASVSEIRKAYRELAKKYHPDVSKEKGAEERYKEINEAYEVLKDQEKREKYDSIGNNWQSGQGFTPPPGWQNMGGGDMGGFSDFFNMFFRGDAGGGFSGGFSNQGTAGGFNMNMGGVNMGNMNNMGGMPNSQHQTPPPAAVDLQITLEDVCRSGAHTLIVRTPHGGERTVKVNLPKGVKDGSQIRIPGKADGGADINVTIHIMPHQVFTPDGYNLTREIKVRPWDAVLGGSIKVDTLNGSVNMKLPPGIQDGQKLRLKGKGLPKRDGTDGDLYVKVRIEIPTAIDAKQRELWEKLKEIS